MSSLARRSIFESRSFNFYFAGQSLSYLGDGLRIIAIPLLVFHLTNSAAALGLTYALEFAPFALFSLVGGSLADRLDRRSLMIACDFARFVIMAVWAAAFGLGVLTIPMIYVGIVVISICAAVFQGGQASSIPFMLGKDRATQAVAALVAVEQATTLITPPLGGAIFAISGPLLALAINSLTYLFSQASLAMVTTMGPRVPSGLPKFSEIARDVAEGFAFIVRDRAMLELTSVGALFNFFGLMTGAVLIPFLKRDLGASDLMVGYALGIGAVGSIAGSWAAAALPRRFPLGRVLQVSYIFDGLLFIPVMVTHSYVVAVTFFAITNALVIFELAQIIGWRMRVIPEALVGRVFGVVRLWVLLGTAPGAIVGGLLAEHFGARVPIVVSGIGYIIVAGIFWCLPGVRREAR